MFISSFCLTPECGFTPVCVQWSDKANQCNDNHNVMAPSAPLTVILSHHSLYHTMGVSLKGINGA